VISATTTAALLAWLAWALLHVGFSTWVRRWELKKLDISGSLDLQIVVPARNEALNIGACVRALCLVEGATHVVIADDGSDDGTGQIALDAASGDARVRVLTVPERPAGWSGKAWACQCAAQGDSRWLLFIDADVRLHPRAAGSAVALAEQVGLELVSLFGRWDVGTFGERLLVPAFGWLIRGAVPMGAVNDPKSAMAFANGQFILVDRAAWNGVGGHGAVKGEVLDDVRLAEALVGAGARQALRWAPWAFDVRLYRSGAEVVAGYRKNLFDGLRRRRVVAAVSVVALLWLFVTPVVALWVGLAGCSQLTVGFAAGALLTQVALRWRQEALDGRPGWIALLHPVAGVVMATTLALSWLMPTTSWKGRSFEGGQAKD
jgi:hypothetical protein